MKKIILPQAEWSVLMDRLTKEYPESFDEEGNILNLMNSVAIVESPAGNRHLHYIVTLTSNILKENSAVAHQTLAMRIHRLLEKRHPIEIVAEQSEATNTE